MTEIERELTRHLAPVAAPDALWSHVQRGPERGRGAGWLRVLAPVAAALLLAASSAVAWRMGVQRPAVDLRQMAAAQLRSGALELESGDAAEVRAWVKQRAGIDVPLSGRIKLLGARMVGDRAAAVACNAGGGRAILVVAPGAEGPHSFSYAVAQAEGAQVRSCLLCHT